MNFIVSCSHCGKTMEVLKQRKEKYNNFFCSKECQSAYRKADDNVDCPVCHKKFHVKPSVLTKRKNICCSLACANKLRESTMLGDKNHQFGLKGELNSSFKSDFRITNYGYAAVRDILHPFRNGDDMVLVHRLIMEQHLIDTEPDSPYLVNVDGYSRLFLDPDVVVHHKDENKFNNTIDNLICMVLSDHTTIHNYTKHFQRSTDGRFVKINGVKKKTESPSLVKKNYQDAGLDIVSNENISINPKTSAIISTGLYIEIPENHVGLIWSRSGLSVKNNIEVGAGCIDASYRGEVKVHLYNYGDNIFEIKIGDRIAQLLTIPVNLNVYTDVDELSSTDRGAGGFGHTGV